MVTRLGVTWESTSKDGQTKARPGSGSLGSVSAYIRYNPVRLNGRARKVALGFWYSVLGSM